MVFCPWEGWIGSNVCYDLCQLTGETTNQVNIEHIMNMRTENRIADDD